MDNSNRYMKKSLKFDTSVQSKLRSKHVNATRRHSRFKRQSLLRNFEDLETSEKDESSTSKPQGEKILDVKKPPQEMSRVDMLKKWKEEKTLKKEVGFKKPVFKVHQISYQAPPSLLPHSSKMPLKRNVLLNQSKVASSIAKPGFGFKPLKPSQPAGTSNAARKHGESSQNIKRTVSGLKPPSQSFRKLLKPSSIVEKPKPPSFAPKNFNFCPPKNISSSSLLKSNVSTLYANEKKKCFGTSSSSVKKTALSVSPSRSQVEKKVSPAKRVFGVNQNSVNIKPEIEASAKKSPIAKVESSNLKNYDLAKVTIQRGLGTINEDSLTNTSTDENDGEMSFLNFLPAPRRSVRLQQRSELASSNDEDGSLAKSKRKVSLLYTPEKVKNSRKSIRGDLMLFSPSS